MNGNYTHHEDATSRRQIRSAVVGRRHMIVLLVALRLNPEGFRGGPFIRALVVRGLFFAAAGAIIAATAALLLRRFSKRRQVHIGLSVVVSATAAFALNLALTCWLSMRYDRDLLSKAEAIHAQRGTVSFTMAGGRSFSIRPGVDGDWIRTEPISTVSELESRMACAAEDERCFERQVPLDPVGLLRATTASVSKVARRSKGSLPGASDLPEQAAGRCSA